MLILKKIFWIIIDYWKIIVPIIILLILGLYLRSCWNSHKAKLNEKQIVEAQQAIAKNDRATMEKVLIESDVEEQLTNDTVANAHTDTQKAVEDAKKKADSMTNQELADELNRRASQ